MSTTQPEVTDRLVEFLYERTAFGDRKYGRPINPFDGRNTTMDMLEEVTDLAQYTMKRVMENEAIADLLERAATNIDPHFGHTPEDVNGHPHPRICQECTANLCDEDGEENWTDEQVEYWRSMNPIVIELRDMAGKLRADCERSVPVEALAAVQDDELAPGGYQPPTEAQTFPDDKKVVEYTWEQREALAARIAIRRSEAKS